MAVVIIYYTESGDEGYAGVFERELTDAEWYGWVAENLDSEICDGECYAFRYEYTLTNVEPIPVPREDIVGI